jgi:hypothetical protein
MDLSIINQFKTSFLATVDKMSQSLTPEQKRVALFAFPIFLVLAALGIGAKVYERWDLKRKAIAVGYSPDILGTVRKSSQDQLLGLITGNGNLFYFANSALKNNKAFIKEVAKVNVYALCFIAPKLKQDEAFMLELIEIDVNAIQSVPTGWRCNQDFMSKVLQINDDSIFRSNALSFASKKVQAELKHMLK